MTEDLYDWFLNICEWQLEPKEVSVDWFPDSGYLTKLRIERHYAKRYGKDEEENENSE